MNEKFTPGTVLCPACRTRTFLQDQPWKRVCLPCYFERKGRATPTTPTLTAPPIEPGMLRRLTYLVHPDKHGGSEAAHIATRFLLSLKGKL